MGIQCFRGIDANTGERRQDDVKETGRVALAQRSPRGQQTSRVEWPLAAKANCRFERQIDEKDMIQGKQCMIQVGYSNTNYSLHGISDAHFQPIATTAGHRRAYRTRLSSFVCPLQNWHSVLNSLEGLRRGKSGYFLWALWKKASMHAAHTHSQNIGHL